MSHVTKPYVAGQNLRISTETGKPGNKNGHGKVMEHANLAKSHGMLSSVMKFNNFAPELYEICNFFATTEKLSIQCFPQNAANAKIQKRDGHGKLRNGHGLGGELAQG